MKITKRFIVILVAVAFAGAVQAREKETEETISKADVPVVVQQAAEKAAKDGKIIRWEKEGKNYEAVVKKEGKKWGLVFTAEGKFVSKHDEAREKEHRD